MTTARRLFRLLSPSQRRASTALLGLMLIGMVMETLGISLVLPALTLMTETDLAARYPTLAPWLDRLGNPSQAELAVFGMLTLVSAFAVKTLFLAILGWRQAAFVWGLQSDLSHRLFAGYLRQPYTFHMQRNSAQLIRNTMGHVAESAIMVRESLVLLTEVLVLVGISALLIWVEPRGALVVMGTLGFSSWAFYYFSRQRLLRWGEVHQHHEGLRIQHLQQGLGGIREVKLYGREDLFLSQYQVHNAGSARAGQGRTTLLGFPRLFLELLAVAGLAGLVLVMIGQGKSPVEVLPALALFAAAAFRLMPSGNRMLSALQSIQFFGPAVETLYSEFRLLDGAPAPKSGHALPFNNTLKLDGVSYRYPLAEAPVLRDVSFSIPQGTSVGFIGESGAGKSTLVDLILGLLSPDVGSVRADDLDVQSDLRGWQSQIGYVPQSVFLTDDTLRRNVAFGLPNEEIDEAAVWQAIRAAQLERFVLDLPLGLDSVVGERGVRLSGGQQQRIGIARALYHQPRVLVLDEATSSLDADTERAVMATVRALNGKKTLIIVAHRFSTVEHCDRLYRFEEGRLVEEGQAATVLRGTGGGR